MTVLHQLENRILLATQSKFQKEGGGRHHGIRIQYIIKEYINYALQVMQNNVSIIKIKKGRGTMAKTIRNMKDLEKALQPMLLGMVDELAKH